MKAVILLLIIGTCLWYVYREKPRVYILIIEIERGGLIDSRLVSND